MLKVNATYPRVAGERDPLKLEHWYWGYSYEVLENGEWKGRSLSVPRSKVAPIIAMIDNHRTVIKIAPIRVKLSNNEIFIVGSKDESFGNSVCQYDGLKLSFRVPYCLEDK